jgi:Holliday junction resolvase RusA-like endonuclease
MNILKITVPTTPISVNCMYRIYKNRLIVSKRGREYKKQMKQHVDEALSNIIDFEPIAGKVKIKIDLHFKDGRKRDLDNHIKSLIDCLKNVLFGDDDMIYEMIVTKQIRCAVDKTEIEITRLE